MTVIEALTAQRNNLLSSLAQAMDENALLQGRIHELELLLNPSPQKAKEDQSHADNPIPLGSSIRD